MSLPRLRIFKSVLSRSVCSNVYLFPLSIGIGFVFFILLFGNVFLFEETRHVIKTSVSPRVERQEPVKKKLILLYTPFWGGKWPNEATLGPSRHHFVEGDTTFKDCEIPSCVVTYNKNKISEADAVGFHQFDMKLSTLTLLSRRRNPQQIWFLYVLENPFYIEAHVGNTGYAGVFNWTMSYRRDSEVYTPYGKYTSLKQGSVEYFTGYEMTSKDKQVAWLVSNCRATERKKYVMELQKYINISIYGKCGDSRSCPRQQRSPICYSLLRRHKFYLAFENAICPDYITEKYWKNAIDNNIVPIVMGGVDFRGLAIPNSYIDVQDFASPKHLADYLLYLDANETAYKEYFHWKKFYRRVATNNACTLCKQLHNDSLYTPPRVYKNLTRFVDKHQCKNLFTLLGNWSKNRNLLS